MDTTTTIPSSNVSPPKSPSVKLVSRIRSFTKEFKKKTRRNAQARRLSYDTHYKIYRLVRLSIRNDDFKKYHTHTHTHTQTHSFQIIFDQATDQIVPIR